MTKQYWLVDFPTYQYKENVKRLALEKGLRVLDKRHAKGINPELIAKDVPTLTKKSAAQAKKEAEGK